MGGKNKNLNDYQKNGNTQSVMVPFDASRYYAPGITNTLGLDQRSIYRKVMDYTFSKERITDLRKRYIDVKTALRYGFKGLKKDVEESALPEVAKAVGYGVSVAALTVGRGFSKAAKAVGGSIKDGAKALADKYRAIQHKIELNRIGKQKGPKFRNYDESEIKKFIRKELKPAFQKAKKVVKEKGGKAARYTGEFARLVAFKSIKATISGLNKAGVFLSTPIRKLATSVGRTAAFQYTKNGLAKVGGFFGRIKDKIADKINEIRYTPNYKLKEYEWQKEDEHLKDMDPEMYSNVERLRADLYNEDNPIKDSNIFKQMKKNIAIRKNLSRIREQLKNDGGNGLGSVEMKDLNSDGTEVNPDEVTNGFTQKVGAFNLGRANGKAEAVELKDIMEEEKESKENNKTFDKTVKNAKEEGKAFLEETRKSNEELMASAVKFMLATGKEIASTPSDYIGKASFLASLGDLEHAYNAGKDGAKGANEYGMLAGSLGKKQGELSTYKNMLTCMEHLEKMAEGKFELKSAKDAHAMTTAFRKTFMDLTNKVFPNLELKDPTGIKFLDSVYALKQAIDKFESNQKTIEGLEKFQKSEDGLKKMQKESEDWNFNRMVGNATDARLDGLKTELIKSGIGATSKALSTIATGLTMGGHAGASYIASKLATGTNIVVTPVVDYVKKHFFDDKAVFYNDIFGGKENFDKLCKDYRVSPDLMEREALRAAGATSVSVLAERARIEQALQITSNNKEQLKVNTKSLIKAGAYKNADKFENVFQAQGGTSSAKHILKGRSL